MFILYLKREGGGSMECLPHQLELASVVSASVPQFVGDCVVHPQSHHRRPRPPVGHQRVVHRQLLQHPPYRDISHIISHPIMATLINSPRSTQNDLSTGLARVIELHMM